MLLCIQKYFLITEEGWTYNVVHSCITSKCKIYMEKYSNKTNANFSTKLQTINNFRVTLLCFNPD
jgi:hypothetical protein